MQSPPSDAPRGSHALEQPSAQGTPCRPDRPGRPARLGQLYLDVGRKRLVFLNETARQLRSEGVPFTTADLVRQPLRTLEGEVVPIGHLPLMVALREMRPAEGTYLLLRKGQPPACISWSAAPHRDEDGRLIGVLASVCCCPPEPDWRKIAGLAHDLGTPLNALQLLVSALDTSGLTDAELRENLGNLRASIDRTVRVGSELLAWCRGPGGDGRRVEPTWFLLDTFLTRLARGQSLTVQSFGLNWSCELAEARGVQAYLDRVRLDRLLTNLLVRARRSITAGTVSLRLGWRDEPGRRALVLSVLATGDTPALDNLESIFSSSGKDQTTRAHESTGHDLGVAVTERLLAELDLDLEVSHDDLDGHSFHLHLPWWLLRPSSDARSNHRAAS